MRRALPLLAALLLAAGCGGDDPVIEVQTEEVATSETEPAIDGAQNLPGGRSLYLKCIGEGSPTVVMEAGDNGTSAYYDDLQLSVAQETRACSYDRANLGESGPAPGPRQLPDLVKDLEDLLRVAELPPPYVLVGSSGGGYIVAGYAVEHRRQTAGIVMFDTFAPDPDPPPEVVKETSPDDPRNQEKRDFLQVEKDAWEARRRIGDIPVRIVTVRYGADAANAAERRNVGAQMGWLVLSPRARQSVVETGHEVIEDDLPYAGEVVLDVVREAKG